MDRDSFGKSTFIPQEGLETWVALFWGWCPWTTWRPGRPDGVPYGDWIRADFLQGCEGDIIDYDAVEQTIWAGGGGVRTWCAWGWTRP